MRKILMLAVATFLLVPKSFATTFNCTDFRPEFLQHLQINKKLSVYEDMRTKIRASNGGAKLRMINESGDPIGELLTWVEFNERFDRDTLSLAKEMLAEIKRTNERMGYTLSEIRTDYPRIAAEIEDVIAENSKPVDEIKRLKQKDFAILNSLRRELILDLNQECGIGE